MTMIIDHLEEKGKAPPYRWLAAELGININAVHNMLKCVAKKGLLNKSGPREGITLTRLGKSWEASRVNPTTAREGNRGERHERCTKGRCDRRIRLC